MSETLFAQIFDTTTGVLSVTSFLACLGTALVIGLVLRWLARTQSSSFGTAIALIPAVVCMVILLVNGNLGAGVAVAGAFSLVRFRSAPGTAQEICLIFLAMAAGLICGMGYLACAILFTIILSAVYCLYSGTRKPGRSLSITIPEDLNYTHAFDDLFESYTNNRQLQQVKTTNLGSLFRLHYTLQLKDAAKEKEFIDELRCRNGNLEIVMGPARTDNTEL